MRLSMNWMNVARGAVAGLVCGLMVAVTPATVHAQMGQAAGIGKLLRPEYMTRDVRIFVEGLELDETQRVIVETLFEDYFDQFDAGLDGLHNDFSNMKDDLRQASPDDVRRRVFEPFENWREKREDLGDNLLQNVQLVLSERQINMWPSFLRRLEREKTLSQGRFAGESVDLLLVVKDVHMDPAVRDQIQPVLDEYELELHEALQHRNRELTESEMAMIDVLQEDKTEQGLEVIDRQIAARLKVRAVNDAYIEEIAAALPAEQGEEFRQKALVRAYPRAYRTQDVQRMFEAALQLELEQELHDALRDLYGEYTTELNEVSSNLHQIIRDHEPVAERNRAELFSTRQGNTGVTKVEDKIAPELRRRNALNDRYIEQLQALLSEDIFKELPEAEQWLAKQKRAEERAMRAKRRAAEMREQASREESRSKRENRGGGPIRANPGSSNDSDGRRGGALRPDRSGRSERDNPRENRGSER